MLQHPHHHSESLSSETGCPQKNNPWRLVEVVGSTSQLSRRYFRSRWQAGKMAVLEELHQFGRKLSSSVCTSTGGREADDMRKVKVLALADGCRTDLYTSASSRGAAAHTTAVEQPLTDYRPAVGHLVGLVSPGTAVVPR